MRISRFWKEKMKLTRRQLRNIIREHMTDSYLFEASTMDDRWIEDLPAGELGIIAGAFSDGDIDDEDPVAYRAITLMFHPDHKDDDIFEENSLAMISDIIKTVDPDNPDEDIDFTIWQYLDITGYSDEDKEKVHDILNNLRSKLDASISYHNNREEEEEDEWERHRLAFRNRRSKDR